MSDPLLAAIRDVPFQIFDFSTDTPEGLLAGFYYNVPLPEDAKVAPTKIFLEGPFETRAVAIDAARQFVQDALTNHNDGTVE